MEISIYGTPSCSYCKAAKEFLDGRGWTYTYYDLTTLDPVVAQSVLDGSGMRTVPIVSIDGRYIGGYEQLVENISHMERN